MKSNILITVMAHVCGIVLGGQSAEIKPEEGMDHIGETVLVRMAVKHMGRAQGELVLNSIGTYKEPKCFIVQISKDIQAELASQGVDDLVSHYAGKTIEATGVVEKVLPGGLARPRIYVTKLDQIRIVDATGTPPTPPPVVAARRSLTDLTEKEVELVLQNGKKYGRVRITKLEPGDARNSIAALTVDCKLLRSRNVPVSTVDDILIEGVPVGLSYDKKSRTLKFDHEKRDAWLKERKAVEQRLAANGGRLWPWLSDEEQDEWIKQHHEFVQSA